MDKFYFPMETMRIKQNPYGNTSHHPHNTGTPKDYPIDCAGIDGNRSAVFAPTEMKVSAIKFCSTNTIWLVSTKKVDTPTFKDYVFMTLTHWNDNDPHIKKHNKAGAIIKKGEIICLEGTDGATANHIHLCCGRGYSDNWVKNSQNKWVMVGDNKPPEQVMYRYTKFTTRVMDNGGLLWKSTNTDTEPDFLPPRGYFTKGDSGINVDKINDFFEKKVNGDLYGDYTTAVVKEFQRQNGLEQDGNIGPKTLAKMEEQGFVE
ncbi:MAG: peptidoglycan-binding protein [Methanobrevibacter sp.]|nr:peptidoglycan-binding protein [Methanobrevibacter sp.]